jgi:hypothetical protein
VGLNSLKSLNLNKLYPNNKNNNNKNKVKSKRRARGFVCLFVCLFVCGSNKCKQLCI